MTELSYINEKIEQVSMYIFFIYIVYPNGLIGYILLMITKQQFSNLNHNFFDTSNKLYPTDRNALFILLAKNLKNISTMMPSR